MVVPYERSGPRAGPPDLRSSPSPVGPAGRPVLRRGFRCGSAKADTTSFPTVFIECGSRYLADGPEAEECAPVGETVFAVQEAERATASPGIATEVAAGIVSFADLRLGAEVSCVLAAHCRERGRGRFRGIRQCVAVDTDGHVPEAQNPAAARAVGQAGLS